MEIFTSKTEILQGDANDLITNIETDSIHLIATDPPYEIGLKKESWDEKGNLNWHFLSEEFKRVLKPNGNLIIFQGWSNVSETKRILDKNFILKNWIIYDRIKGRGGKTNVVSTREDILWYISNDRNYTFNKISSTILKKTKGMGEKNGNPYRALSNVWSDVPPLVPWSQERVNHPTQKPLFLMDRIISIWSNENDLVLDPFAGSGSTALSCQNLNRNFIGFELNQDYFKIAENRITKHRRFPLMEKSV